jgi:alpha-glucosidase
MQREWWRDAVVYQVYVRSFADSDGDGVGDLEGIRSHLPHVAALGVDAVWLTPFYPSPMADHGYDVADYCDVEPLFGDLAAFDRLLADAHDAGLKVIVDVVPNHTSSAHAWFQEALADPSSPARSRYVFRDGKGPDGSEPPNNWQSIFGGPAWERESPDGQWYLHMFDVGQPDLDWENREVHDELLRVLRFWLDRGVDGFRVDVAHSLYQHPDLADAPPSVVDGVHVDVSETHIWDQDAVLAVYEEWRRLLDSYPGDRMMVGEVFLFDVPRIARYVGDERMHQAFNFTVMRSAGRAGAAPGGRGRAGALLAGTWVLSNHDQPRHVTRYGGGRPRPRRGLAVSALVYGLPGSPYLYEGEELGWTRPRCRPSSSRTRGSCAPAASTPAATAAARRSRGTPPRRARLHHRHAVAAVRRDAAALAVDLQEADPFHAARLPAAARHPARLLAAGLPDEVELLDTAPGRAGLPPRAA